MMRRRRRSAWEGVPPPPNVAELLPFTTSLNGYAYMLCNCLEKIYASCLFDVTCKLDIYNKFCWARFDDMQMYCLILAINFGK